MISLFLAFLLAGSVGVSAADSGSRKASDISSLQEGLGKLEEMYIQDCQDDPSPHGYYGAFLQPCDFSFFHFSTGKGSSSGCETGNLVGTRKPINWLFDLQKHIDEDDWDELSSDDIPDWDNLMLWPDQCVGVEPRCYAFNDISHRTANNGTDMMAVLQGLFPDEIPDGATHVQVDCRVDAMELSRVAYSVASGVEKGLGFAIAVFLFVILLFVVGMSFCCYGCFRVCFPKEESREKRVPIYHAVSVGPEFVREDILLQQKDGLELATQKRQYQAVAV